MRRSCFPPRALLVLRAKCRKPRSQRSAKVSIGPGRCVAALFPCIRGPHQPTLAHIPGVELARLDQTAVGLGSGWGRCARALTPSRGAVVLLLLCMRFCQLASGLLSAFAVRSVAAANGPGRQHLASPPAVWAACDSLELSCSPLL